MLLGLREKREEVTEKSRKRDQDRFNRDTYALKKRHRELEGISRGRLGAAKIRVWIYKGKSRYLASRFN